MKRMLPIGHMASGARLAIAALLTLVSAFSATHAGDHPQVDGLIASGEFGAAVDVAEQEDPITKAELMQRIVHAQIQAGDLNNAENSLPLFAGQGNPRGVRGDLARNQMLNGGVVADFDSLIELIQNQTSGPWMEIDGIGANRPEEYESGVRVDPAGVLANVSRVDHTGRLATLGKTAREAVLNDDMARSAGLRLVSLTRLEREVAQRLAEGKPIVESMKQLAGLTQVQYVFVFPEDGEIVLGGPAEPWRYNEFGMPVGVDSGRPPLQLDDLVTVLRTFSDDGQRMFGCSIDPQPENIRRVKDFAAASQANGALSPRGVRNWAAKIGQLLGLQDISVYGVPDNSRVARVLVEADYRMKLIGIGKLEGGSHIPSYFELLNKQPELASGGLDAMRWWMTMKYDAVMHAADGNSFELRGSAVQCKSENQFLTDQGKRVNTGKAEPINQEFARNFTDHYGELAGKDPVFAELQGVFDLALVAALIDREHLDDKANWDRGVFSTSGAYRPASYAAPKQTETVINHRVYNGQDVVLQAAGGVRGDILSVLENNELRQENPRLGSLAVNARRTHTDKWWWDAE